MPKERERLFAEDCAQFSVREIPVPGKRTYLRWDDGASVTLERQGEAARIHYRWRDGDVLRVTTQTARLVADIPPLGGRRFYFACPDCGRWARKLYAVAGRFGCRRCGRLANRSQTEGGWARALRRARKLRCYLGAGDGAGDPLPPRPKGMRTRTYRALYAEVQALETIPLEAWLSDGRDVKLNVRRSRMSASKRRWWPARNGWGEPARSSR